MRSQVLGRPCPAGVSAAARRGALVPPPAGFTAPTPGLRGGLLCAAVPPKWTRSSKDASSFKLLDMSTKEGASE